MLDITLLSLKELSCKKDALLHRIVLFLLAEWLKRDRFGAEILLNMYGKPWSKKVLSLLIMHAT